MRETVGNSSDVGSDRGSAPGYVMRPDYVIDIRRTPDRVTVTVGDVVVADTTQALRVDEQEHVSVRYIPHSDVRIDLLVADESASYCPFKGDAAYWRLAGGEIPIAWEYREPYAELAQIAGHIAFYPDRVRIEVASADPAGGRP